MNKTRSIASSEAKNSEKTLPSALLTTAHLKKTNQTETPITTQPKKATKHPPTPLNSHLAHTHLLNTVPEEMLAPYCLDSMAWSQRK